MTAATPTNPENRSIPLPLDGGGRGRGWTKCMYYPPPESSPAKVGGDILFSQQRGENE